MAKIPSVVSFSVKDQDTSILEAFNDIVRKGDLNRSAIFIRLMRDFINGNEKSKIEQLFQNYCDLNHLDRDAQLMLLMTNFRVSNNGMDPYDKEPEDYDFFNTAERTSNE